MKNVSMFKYLLTGMIAAVWFINGLICKVLNIVPRHQEIVASILSEQYAPQITFVIGFLEIMMGIWILTGYRKKLCGLCQMLVVLSMNILEFLLVKDLLMWGGFNLLFASLFCLIVFFWTFDYYNISFKKAYK